MSKRHRKNSQQTRSQSTAANSSAKFWWIAIIALVALGGFLFAMRQTRNPPMAVPTATGPGSTHAKTGIVSVSGALEKLSETARAALSAAEPASNPVPTMEAAQSVVVTHDLDYGTERPGLAAIINDIERRYQAEDGFGRTFAILEAFNGEVQPDGKIRVSLRVSTEKPGAGEIVFRRNTNSLWKVRITPATQKPAFTGGNLTILFDDGNGKSFMVDGSTGPQNIFAAILKESSLPVAQVWPEGAERELTFIYSACGCPVKVSARRAGEKTVRSKEQSQVIFPDDPAAVQVINRLMGW